MTQHIIEKDLRYNISFNLLEGMFFGLGMGLASSVTIIPLFVSNLTDSAILIGLVPAMHSAGWYLPQLFTAKSLSRQTRFKGTVMRYTFHERAPFLGLAAVAWLSPQLDNKIALVFIFIFLIWQGLGGGFTANPWQNLIGKIIPERMHGVFLGAQLGIVSIFSGIGALLTGMILERYTTPNNFALAFTFAGVAVLISMSGLAMVKEHHKPVETDAEIQDRFSKGLISILRNDFPFRKFLLVRSLMQLGVMSISFYTVYAVQEHGAPGQAIGIMTAIMSVTQVFANLILGRIGDLKGHQFVLKLGAIALSLSALVAWLATDYQWFYLAFMLAGVAFVTVMTTQMLVTLQFGNGAQRPAYIGLSNTITAPSALLAPVLGGWLADKAGYQITFLISIFTAILILGLLHERKPAEVLAEAS
jgi:MFS family permease